MYFYQTFTYFLSQIFGQLNGKQWIPFIIEGTVLDDFLDKADGQRDILAHGFTALSPFFEQYEVNFLADAPVQQGRLMVGWRQPCDHLQ